QCRPTERVRVLRRHGLQWQRSACRGTVEVVHTVSGQSLPGVLRMLSRDPSIDYAEPNQLAYALDLPNDQLFSYQWHLQNTGCGGIAPDAALMPVKVLDAQGAGQYDAIAEGIRFAVDHGADIINLSLGGPSYSAVIDEAVQYAVSHGAVVCAASGNSGSRGLTFPASLPSVIAVGAVRFDGTRAYYSNYGPELDLVAPGGDSRV